MWNDCYRRFKLRFVSQTPCKRTVIGFDARALFSRVTAWRRNTGLPSHERHAGRHYRKKPTESRSLLIDPISLRWYFACATSSSRGKVSLITLFQERRPIYNSLLARGRAPRQRECNNVRSNRASGPGADLPAQHRAWRADRGRWDRGGHTMNVNAGRDANSHRAHAAHCNTARIVDGESAHGQSYLMLPE